MNVTINLQSAVTVLLLIALTVFVVFLIVLAGKLIGTIRRVNKLIDDATNMLENTSKQINKIISNAQNKSAKGKLSLLGLKAGQSVIDKLLKKNGKE